MKERIETKETESSVWLTAAFEKNPRLASGGDFLEVFRQEQFTRFIKRGLPTRREEAWKYNDLSFLEKSSFHWPTPRLEVLAENTGLRDLLVARAQDNILLVFINGHFSPELSALPSLPPGVILGSLQQALKTEEALLKPYLLREIDEQRYPFAALNAALFSDGVFIYLPEATCLEKPVHVLSISSGSESFMTQSRHLVILERAAKLSFTEEYRSEGAEHYFMNVAADFYVGQEAQLDYNKIQNEASQAKHFSTLSVQQKKTV